jgi:hypothetical protein
MSLWVELKMKQMQVFEDSKHERDSELEEIACEMNV